MKYIQLKLLMKKSTPPIWRRCRIPGGITFAQLALLMEDLLEMEPAERYEFEFFQKGVQLREYREGESAIASWKFDFQCAPDIYLDSLMEEKDWFTFRVEGQPEYRVTVEAMEEAGERQEASEGQTNKNHQETSFFPTIMKQTKAPAETKAFWSDMEEKNIHLKERFSVTYGQADHRTFPELLEAALGGETGLRGSVEAVSRTDRNQESAETRMKQVGAVLREALMQKEANEALEQGYEALEHLHALEPSHDSDLSRNPKLQEYFMTATREELLKEAEKLHLEHCRSLKKAELAERIRDEILSPELMAQRFSDLREEEIRIFERAMEQGCFLPKEEEEMAFSMLHDLDYVVFYSDGYAEVPKEVAAAYSRINTPQYRDRRKKLRWMKDCLKIVELYYVSAPVDIVHQLFRKGKGFQVSRREFLEIFNAIPTEENACVLRDDMIVLKETLPNDLYLSLRKNQEGKTYYIPEAEEVENYVLYGYPAESTQYQSLLAFLMNEFSMEPWDGEELLAQMFQMLSFGEPISAITKLMEKRRLVFSSEQAFSRFARLVTEANNHTRMFVHRGHTPEEILKEHRNQEKMKKTGKAETEETAEGRKGLFLAPVSHGPQTVQQEKRETAGKKIYPNDPCPCGSGKKYKKCCGR